jgi:hypothetical protein
MQKRGNYQKLVMDVERGHIILEIEVIDVESVHIRECNDGEGGGAVFRVLDREG